MADYEKNASGKWGLWDIFAIIAITALVLLVILMLITILALAGFNWVILDLLFLSWFFK